MFVSAVPEKLDISIKSISKSLGVGCYVARGVQDSVLQNVLGYQKCTAVVHAESFPNYSSHCVVYF